MASLHCSTHKSCVWLGRKQPVLTLHRCQPLRSRPSAFNARHVQRKQLARAAEVSSHARKAQVSCNAAQSEASIDQDTDLIGEDAAYFDVKQQTTKKWTLFTALLVGVLGLIYVVSYCSMFIHVQSTSILSTKGHHTSNTMDNLMQTWVDPDTGVANNFLDVLKSISSNTEVVMLLILAVFAASHSGLAYLRPWGKL